MVEPSSYIVPWQGGSLRSGLAPCALTFLCSIGTKEQVNVDSASNPVLSADKQVVGRRNLFFRALLVKVQEQRWCMELCVMSGAGWG